MPQRDRSVAFNKLLAIYQALTRSLPEARYDLNPNTQQDTITLYWNQSGVLTNLYTRFIGIENRIYREELKESLGMIFFSPFKPEREFKVYKSCKCSQRISSRVH